MLVFAVVALAPLAHTDTTTYANIFGPLIGGIFALGVSRGYLDLRRDARERELLVESLQLAHQEMIGLQAELALTQRHSGAIAERTRLSRDIHDTVAQGLSSIALLVRAELERDRDADILRAMEAGAAGYLMKDVSPNTIVEAIQAAARGDMVLAPELATRIMRGMRNPVPRLTQRELEVLQQLAVGASNKEIAKTLFVSEATVKSHLVHIFTKLGVENRAPAIHVAVDTGILRPHS